jgi:hypothetical protein
MRTYTSSFSRRSERSRKRLPDWLVYLPGALIIIYGFWLSLTVS